VGSGYTLSSFVVSKGVTVAVLSGGIVTSATSVGNGGILELLGGSTASATLISGATLEVASGYVLNGQVVSKGRTLDVAADGAASATVILAGGTEIIASGGSELGGETDRLGWTAGNGRRRHGDRERHRDQFRDAVREWC
jgi:autotransporter passenger strand-loop-strand repeat protein